MFTIYAFNKIFFKGRITLLTYKKYNKLCWGQKKSGLVSGNRQGENFFIIHPPALLNVYQNIFNFKKQTNKRKKSENANKAKETKEEKRISKENWSKNNFSRHPHFRKQEYSFFWPDYTYHIPSQASTINLSSL